MTEFQDDDGNKKACDVIARITTPNSDGVPEQATIRYASTTFNDYNTIIVHRGEYRTEFQMEEDESQSGPPFGGNLKGGKKMRTKVNGLELDNTTYAQFLLYSPDGAKKKRAIQYSMITTYLLSVKRQRIFWVLSQF